MIIAIVAVDNKMGIARNNKIPWYIPKDLKYFRKKTMGHPIIMGYNTYLTINKPLPGRKNWVYTTKSIPGFSVFNSIEDILDKYVDKDIFVIGGTKTYEQWMPYIDKIILTSINNDFDCDKFFPMFNKEFEMSYKSRQYSDNGQKYRYEHWTRRQSASATN